MPLAPAAILAARDTLCQFSRDFLHMDDRGITDFNDDHAIASTMIALQTVVYLLAKPAPRAAVGSLIRLCRRLFERVHELCALFPATQRIVDKLRNDPAAEDMLQKALSGILARRPLTQVERLRLVETILKRTYKHHDSLLRDRTACQGMFAVLSIAPVMVAHGSGILSEEKAVEQVTTRVARLPELLRASSAAGTRGEGVFLHALASASGLARTSPLAFDCLSAWCKQRDGMGRLRNLGRLADFDEFGFSRIAELVNGAALRGLEALESAAALATFPSAEGVPLKYAAVLLRGWRPTPLDASDASDGTAGSAASIASATPAAGGAGAAPSAGASAPMTSSGLAAAQLLSGIHGSYSAVHRHSDGSIAIFDIRSLLQHLNGATCCSVTDTWAVAEGGTPAPAPATSSASGSAMGGAGAAAMPAPTPDAGCAATVSCGARCAARLAIQQTTASLLSFAVVPLAPAGALARSGALVPFAQALLHTPQLASSSSADAAGLDPATDAASVGLSALVVALLNLLRLMASSTAGDAPASLSAASTPSPSSRSFLRVCRALVASIHDLRDVESAVASTLDRLRDEPCWIKGDMTMKALSGLLSGRLLPLSYRLRIVETLLKRTYAAGQASLLSEPVRRASPASAGAATTAAAAAAAAAAADADEGTWEFVSSSRSSLNLRAPSAASGSRAAHGGAGSARGAGSGSAAARGSTMHHYHGRHAAAPVRTAAPAPAPAPAPPRASQAASTSLSAASEAFSAVALVSILTACCTGSLSEDDAVSRLTRALTSLPALLSLRETGSGTAAEGAFLQALASAGGWSDTSDEAFARLAAWCNERSSAGTGRSRLCHLAFGADFPALGFRP